MNKKDYQKPSIWVMRFQFPQSLLGASNGINGTRENYKYTNTENDDEWDVDENSSIWNN